MGKLNRLTLTLFEAVAKHPNPFPQILDFLETSKQEINASKFNKVFRLAHKDCPKRKHKGELNATELYLHSLAWSHCGNSLKQLNRFFVSALSFKEKAKGKCEYSERCWNLLQAMEGFCEEFQLKGVPIFQTGIKCAHGTYGAVYLSYMNENGKWIPVALKELRERHMNKEAQEKTLREEKVLSASDNERIVKFYGSELKGEVRVQVFEYIHSGTLREYMDRKFGEWRRDSLSWPETKVKDLFFQIVSTMRFLSLFFFLFRFGFG